MVIALALVACGDGDEAPPGAEGGECLPDQGEAPRCDDGLTCVSEVCVDLSSAGATSSVGTGGAEGSGEETGGAEAGEDETSAGSDPTSVSDSADPSGDPTNDTNDSDTNDSDTPDSGAGDACPLPLAQLNCDAICNARRAYCENCHDEAGPCTWYLADSHDQCVETCEYTYGLPELDDLVHELDACFQVTGGSCEWDNCVLDANC